jgi:DNA sulfur modification protein DndD
MILTKLQLENFRQFFGTQSLEFASKPDRNVTLIHGFNGAGKTALLNAFIWCLYGKTTPDFEDSELLASEAAFANAKEGEPITVRVRMTFRLSDRSVYVVDRSKVFVRRGANADGQPDRLDLSIQKDGSSQLDDVQGAKQQRINSILAESLYKFFFFNGERIEWFASAAAYEEVEEGVKSLLDIKIYERSLTHLQKLSRDLAQELKQHGGADLNAAVDELERLKNQVTELEATERQLHSNIGDLEAEKDRFEREQASMAELRVLAAQRDGLRRDRQREMESLSQRTGELAKLFSNDGYLAFAEPVLSNTMSAVAEARQRGELPAKIKPQFVKDLLDEGKCICGTLLDEEHPSEVACLKKWELAVGLAQHEEAVNQTSAAVAQLQVRRATFFVEIDRLQGIRTGLKASIRQVNDKLDDVETRMGDPTAGDRAADLASQIERVTSELIDRRADLKINAAAIAENAKAQEGAERDVSRKQVADQQGELVRRRRNTVEKVSDVLRQIYELRKQDVRVDVSERIGKLWREAAIKDYEASLDGEFQLKLTKKVAGHVQPVRGASTGEKQVLALSFVGSLVDKARANLHDNIAGDDEVPRGGLYPLVMDSAFGSLEDEYREKVARWIPTLAHQVILLVSKTQWRDEVEREVRPRVGQEYVLELHSTKADTGRDIEILGETFPYVVATSDPYERTQIQRISK